MEEVKKGLKEDGLSVAISAIRIALTPVVIYLIFIYPKGLTIMLIFLLASLTDMADGAARILAKRLGKSTAKGEFWDSTADRIFFSSIALILILKYQFLQTPFYTSLFLLFSREIIVLFCITFTKVKFKKIHPTPFISKLTTFMQASAMCAFLLNLSFTSELIWITFVLGILSAIKYVRTKTID